MNTRLFLVRHGPTHAKSMVGWSDIPADLSDTAALARLDSWLPDGALVVSSDLVRAVHTADAIQGGRRRLPHMPALREIHFGDWELRTWAEVNAEDPERIRAYWEQPGDSTPPGGESWNDVRGRVDTAIDALIARHGGQDLIIAGHFGQILTQVQRAGGLTAAEAFSHKIDNLSVSEVTHTPDGWRCGRINHIP